MDDYQVQCSYTSRQISIGIFLSPALQATGIVGFIYTGGLYELGLTFGKWPKRCLHGIHRKVLAPNP